MIGVAPFQVRGILPLSLFKLQAGESLLYFLTSYGASVEDILLEAIRLAMSAPHQIAREQVEFYCDTSQIEHGYEVVTSHGQSPHTLNDVMTKFQDAVYMLYCSAYYELRYLFRDYAPIYEPTAWELTFSEIQPLGVDAVVTVDIVPDQGEPG